MLRLVLLLFLASLLVSTPARATDRVTRHCQGEPATLVGTAHADHLVGTSRRDVVVAGKGDDLVLGRGGDDLICGGRGEDVLDGGPGDDRLVGGPDGHTLDVDTCLQGDHLDGGAGDDRLLPGRDPRRPYDGCGTLDELRFRHGSGPVHVDLTTGLATGHGRDRIVVDQPLSVVGSDGDDVLVGGDDAEVFDPRGGTDQVSTGGGADRVEEGEADDGDDAYDLGDGADFLVSRSGADVVLGGPGDDYLLLASPSAGQADGGPGRDRIDRRAVPGSDRLSGGEGDDELTLELLEETEVSELDIPAGLWSFGERTTAVDGFERWRLVAPVPWTVLGSEERDELVAPGAGGEPAPLTAYLRGGNDWATSYLGDDHVDGGPGVDSAYLGPGANTCVDVEEGPC